MPFWSEHTPPLPHDSKFWNVTNNGYRMKILEQCIVDLYQDFDDFHLIICGDLNAVTGKENYIRYEYIFCDNESDDNDDQTSERNSDDREIKIFGRQLLDVCKMCEVSFLNGLCQRGFNDSCTYTSSLGCSPGDYVLKSSDHIQSATACRTALKTHLFKSDLY